MPLVDSVEDELRTATTESPSSDGITMIGSLASREIPRSLRLLLKMARAREIDVDDIVLVKAWLIAERPDEIRSDLVQGLRASGGSSSADSGALAQAMLEESFPGYLD